MSTRGSTPPPFSSGDILAGKYRIERVLGRGAMGIVVAAHHLELDEKVALKFLHAHALQSAEAVARFEREARAAVKVKSEHVARVADMGRLESGAPYLVMEYLEGLDLAAWLRQRGPMPVEQAVELVLQACEAIAEAHVLGIVHRDLKPSNLFCVRRADGLLSAKVLDFGVSKVVVDAAGALTRTTSVLGSPLYMSPEQIQSPKSVDTRSDVWSLGVVLYELVSGQVPFSSRSVTELMMRIGTAAPFPLRSCRPDLPLGFDDVVLRCLEKDREQRFPSVAELAVALAGYGPRRASGSVERIQRTVQTAGISRGLFPPGETRAAHWSTPAVGRPAAPSLETTGTAERVRSRAAVVALVCGALVTALGVGGAIACAASAWRTGATATALASLGSAPSSTLQPVEATSTPPDASIAPPAGDRPRDDGDDGDRVPFTAPERGCP
jgi:serine/threonine-protein kinase